MNQKVKVVNLDHSSSGSERKKIIVIGPEGDVGQAVIAALSPRHEIIRASRSGGDIRVDIADRSSIEAMYRQSGRIDAVVCAAGAVHFGLLADFTEKQFMLGLTNKVMGQVNLVLQGLDCMTDGGSFTLTSGVLDRDPIAMGAGASTANAALAGFVLGAAVEMPRGIRVNVVSPGLLDVSEEKFGEYFPGHVPVASRRVGSAYLKSIEGVLTGKVIKVD